jgi:biopolymer transport protein ExbD
MKANWIPRMMAVGFILSTGSILARDEGPPKSETELLRDRVTLLEQRIKQLEALLTAKEILPPSRFERPELWTSLKITLDAAGVMRLGDAVIDTDSLKKSIQQVFKNGKFPDVTISALPDTSFKKIEALLNVLGAAGVPNVSYELSRK